jgi:hypothetical protein
MYSKNNPSIQYFQKFQHFWLDEKLMLYNIPGVQNELDSVYERIEN